MTEDKFKAFIDESLNLTVFAVILILEPLFKALDGLNWVISAWYKAGYDRYKTHKARKSLKNYGEDL